MSDERLTDAEAAVRFLEWKLPGGPWPLTVADPDWKTGTPTSWARTSDEVRALVDAHSGSSGVFYTTAVQRDGVTKKPCKADLVETRHLHVDLDPPKDIAPDAVDAWILSELERVRSQTHSPPPSVIVRSGNGLHLLWALDEVLFLGGAPERISDVEERTRALCADFGADGSTWNADRLLRLPGTANLPNGKKRKLGRTARATAIVELHPDRVYPLDVFRCQPEVPTVTRRQATNEQATNEQAKAELGERIMLGDPADLEKWDVPAWVGAVIVYGHNPEEPDRWGGDRSAAQWAVTCELARCRVPPGLIVGILTDRTWGISAHVLDQKSPTPYAWTQAEKAYREADESWPMRSVEVAVDWINRRYFAALEGKRVTFFREDAAKLYPMDKEAFAFELAGKDVVLRSLNKEQRVPASQLWTRDGRRRYYPEGLVLEPGRTDDGRAYNLWRGFGVDPRPGDWSLMRAHIENILASGDASHADYIIKWAAWSFQNPATPPGTALVFQGGEGVGKGMFAQALMKAFGQHGLHVRSMTQVTGRFNAHLRHCCLLFADEANAANAREEGALKGLITERSLACEGKGKDLIQVENHIHMVMASNEDWAVPAGKDSRRFAVFQVSPGRQRDKAYFSALARQMASGGLEAMVYDMLAMDLSGFHPEHDRPDTDALAEQRAASLRGFERFWCDILRSGEMPPMFSTEERGGDRVFIGTSDVRDFAMQKMRRDDLTLSEVGRFFALLSFEKADSGRPRGWIVPSLPEARRLWDTKFFAVPWDGTRTWALPEERSGDGGPY